MIKFLCSGNVPGMVCFTSIDISKESPNSRPYVTLLDTAVSKKWNIITILNFALKFVQFPWGFYDLQKQNWLHYNGKSFASISEALRIKAHRFLPSTVLHGCSTAHCWPVRVQHV